MRVLGVNGAGDALYVAVADDGAVVDLQPHTFEFPAGTAADQQVAGARHDMERVLRSLNAERVRILDGEPTYKATVQQLRRRIALETLLASPRRTPVSSVR